MDLSVKLPDISSVFNPRYSCQFSIRNQMYDFDDEGRFFGKNCCVYFVLFCLFFLSAYIVGVNQFSLRVLGTKKRRYLYPEYY